MTELAIGFGDLLPSGRMGKTSAPEAFRQLLKVAVARFKTRQALGDKIKVSGSRVGRALNGQYAFNVENCLRLAAVTGDAPSSVLRAAGHTDVADLIETFYGRGRPVLSPVHRELLDAFDAQTPSVQRTWLTLLREYAAQSKQSTA